MENIKKYIINIWGRVKIFDIYIMSVLERENGIEEMFEEIVFKGGSNILKRVKKGEGFLEFLMRFWYYYSRFGLRVFRLFLFDREIIFFLVFYDFLGFCYL